MAAAENWFSEGQKTNPSTGDLLADTGALPVENGLLFTFIISSSVAFVADLQHRDATNTSTLKSQLMICPATDTITFGPVNRYFLISERLRIVVGSGFTGACQASIFAPGMG